MVIDPIVARDKERDNSGAQSGERQKCDNHWDRCGEGRRKRQSLSSMGLDTIGAARGRSMLREGKNRCFFPRAHYQVMSMNCIGSFEL